MSIYIPLRDTFSDWLRKTCSWTAICRGAVIHATTQQNLNSIFKVDVQHRIARASYGILVWVKPWDRLEHLIEDKRWDDMEQCFRAGNQMSWLLKEVRVQSFNSGGTAV